MIKFFSNFPTFLTLCLWPCSELKKNNVTCTNLNMLLILKVLFFKFKVYKQCKKSKNVDDPGQEDYFCTSVSSHANRFDVKVTESPPTRSFSPYPRFMATMC